MFQEPKIVQTGKNPTFVPRSVEIEIKLDISYFLFNLICTGYRECFKNKIQINTFLGGLQDFFNNLTGKTYDFSGEWDSGSFLTSFVNVSDSWFDQELSEFTILRD